MELIDDPFETGTGGANGSGGASGGKSGGSSSADGNAQKSTLTAEDGSCAVRRARTTGALPSVVVMLLAAGLLRRQRTLRFSLEK